MGRELDGRGGEEKGVQNQGHVEVPLIARVEPAASYGEWVQTRVRGCAGQGWVGGCVVRQAGSPKRRAPYSANIDLRLPGAPPAKASSLAVGLST